MKKVLLPLLLAAMMLIMSVTASAAASPESKTISTKNATVSVSAVTYNGTAKKAAITVKYKKSGTKISSNYYTVTYKDKNGNKVNPKDAGTYTAYIKFKAPYNGTMTGKFTINKCRQAVRINVSKKNKNVNKSKRTYTIIKIKENPEITVTRVSGSKKITIKGKTVTVKKGTKNAKATFKYIMKETKNHKTTTRYITVRVSKRGNVSVHAE